MLNRSRLLIAAALGVAVAAGPAPALAQPVTTVDGDRARLVDDPFVPPRAEIDLGPAPAGRATVRARGSARGGRAVSLALRRAERAGSATASAVAGYRRTLAGARAALRRLRGARRSELGYVVGSLERIALARRLTASRMPALFLQLRRNASYWRSKPFPAAGDQITFRGSELLFQYFPGRGLQLHPLSNFKKANLLHGACTRSGSGRPVCGAKPPGPRRGTPCRKGRLRRLLDELSKIAVKRGRDFIAWEYLFDFGGGSPPWMSAMAQSTAIVALGRAARLLDRPQYNVTAGAALGAFDARRPTGVRTRGPLGGTHYLQYSFAPRLYVFNAFLQSLIGLYDYARLARDERARALYDRAEPEARREVPAQRRGRLVALLVPRARSPRGSTTSCCARCSRAWAGAWAASTATTPSATAATRPTRRGCASGARGRPRPSGRPAWCSPSPSSRWWSCGSSRAAGWCSAGSSPCAAAATRSAGGRVRAASTGCGWAPRSCEPVVRFAVGLQRP